MIDLNDDTSANFSPEQAIDHLKKYLDKISKRYTKKYSEPTVTENEFIIGVEFFEPENKKPVPEQKVKLIFNLPKDLNNNNLSFQIDNESVFFPMFNSINLNYFETVLDRIILNKERTSRTILLHTAFESNKIFNLNGDKIRLYTVDDEENIFSNNQSEFFQNEDNFHFLSTQEIDNYIKLLWKTLNTENLDHIKFDQFKLLFDYGELKFHEENLSKLWSYCDKAKKNAIKYPEFFNFCLDLIHCLRSYYIAKYKYDNNLYNKKKIDTRVEIMNLHFKEYDFDENQEISFENLKKCLSKENDLFSRKEAEIILNQINPEKNFEYWKFDKILKILYEAHFDYSQIMKEDKIYKYLISIFKKQDTELIGRLHFKKMKKAFLIEDKLKLNKTQILIILNFFDIQTNPEIDYYKACLIIRNVIFELFSGDISMQKLEMSNSKYCQYKPFEDTYDSYFKALKETFIQFDRDFDHVLNKKEFFDYLYWLIPYLSQDKKEAIFTMTDSNKDAKISFYEFRDNYPNLIQMTRIKNVIKAISHILE